MRFPHNQFRILPCSSHTPRISWAFRFSKLTARKRSLNHCRCHCTRASLTVSLGPGAQPGSWPRRSHAGGTSTFCLEHRGSSAPQYAKSCRPSPQDHCSYRGSTSLSATRAAKVRFSFCSFSDPGSPICQITREGSLSSQLL